MTSCSIIIETTVYACLVPYSRYSKLSKVADFCLSCSHLAPQLGLTPLEFHQDLWLQETRVPVLLCIVDYAILRSAFLVEH